MATFRVQEEAVNVVNDINNKIMSMDSDLNEISKRINSFTQQDWISDAATNCKNAIDKHVLDAKKYFADIQKYLSDLNLTIEKSFENESNRENIINGI